MICDAVGSCGSLATAQPPRSRRPTPRRFLAKLDLKRGRDTIKVAVADAVGNQATQRRSSHCSALSSCPTGGACEECRHKAASGSTGKPELEAASIVPAPGDVGEEPVETTIRRLAKYGYDSIEISYDSVELSPGAPGTKAVAQMLKDNGITWENASDGLVYSPYQSVIGDGKNLYACADGYPPSEPLMTSPESDGTQWVPWTPHGAPIKLDRWPFGLVYEPLLHAIYFVQPTAVGVIKPASS